MAERQFPFGPMGPGGKISAARNDGAATGNGSSIEALTGCRQAVLLRCRDGHIKSPSLVSFPTRPLDAGFPE